ncbi:MAG: potassium channel family protein, partial [Acholeplasmatales bacterium]|nr:potassium channel family protein [Acholeplasmatales bacterium]
ITNVLLGLILVGLVVAVLCNIDKDNSLQITIVDVVLLLFTSLRKLFFPSLKFEKIKLLLDILVKTHTIDALLGLLAFIVAFSFLFPLVEPSITNYWDGMWYCFAIVTTIGFGDFYATSLLGRMLSVILGIYGIVVVAILTSVVVSFYNEISSKEKKRDIIE